MNSAQEDRARVVTRDGMLGRVRSLALGEAVNVVIQPVLFFLIIEIPPSIANVTGMALAVWLLTQGSAYWFAKYRQLSRQLASLPGEQVFLSLRWINPVLLGIGLVAILASMRVSPVLHSWPGIFFWSFASLEYINYFHKQLTPAGTVPGWLPRRSRLANDVLRAKSSAK